MTRSRLIYGIGINDADYTVKKIVNGKEVSCKFYQTWKTMLSRCYSDKLQEKCPTYIGCEVCADWLSFMSFRRWMIQQDWNGMQLDKDIIKPGNKVYCPESCAFVTQAINKLLTDSKAIRGDCPQGVYLNKSAHKYQAYIKIDGVKKSLGYFNKVIDASNAYIKAKCSRIIDIANNNKDERVSRGLYLHAEILNEGFNNG